MDLRSAGGLIALAVLVVLSASSILAKPVKQVTSPGAFVGEGINALAVALLQDSQSSSSPNVAFSPLGHAAVLAALAEGAAGSTQGELLAALRLPRDAPLGRTAYRAVLSRLQEKKKLNKPEFRSWFYVYKTAIQVEKTYADLLRDNYLMEVHDIDAPEGELPSELADKRKPGLQQGSSSTNEEEIPEIPFEPQASSTPAPEPVQQPTTEGAPAPSEAPVPKPLEPLATSEAVAPTEPAPVSVEQPVQHENSEATNAVAEQPNVPSSESLPAEMAPPATELLPPLESEASPAEMAPPATELLPPLEGEVLPAEGTQETPQEKPDKQPSAEEQQEPLKEISPEPNNSKPLPEEPVKEPSSEPEYSTSPEPAAEEPAAEQPAAEEPAAEEPAAEQPAAEQPAAEQPAAEEPAAEEPAAEKPAAEEPAAEEPAAEEPAAEEPAAEEPAAEEPAAEEPAKTQEEPAMAEQQASTEETNAEQQTTIDEVPKAEQPTDAEQLTDAEQAAPVEQQTDPKEPIAEQPANTEEQANVEQQESTEQQSDVEQPAQPEKQLMAEAEQVQPLQGSQLAPMEPEKTGASAEAAEEANQAETGSESKVQGQEQDEDMEKLKVVEVLEGESLPAVSDNYVPEDPKASGSEIPEDNEMAESNNAETREAISSRSPASPITAFNALYFRGAWATPFDGRQTASFSVSPNSSVAVNMLSTVGLFRIGDVPELAATALELPYSDAGGRYSLLILLPHATEGSISKLASTLSTRSLRSLGRYMSERLVHVQIPDFEIGYVSYPQAAFRKLGVKAALEPDLAEFPGISRSQRLFLQPDALAQLVRFRVDATSSSTNFLSTSSLGSNSVPAMEQASQSLPAEAAETGASVRTGAMQFRADRPFVFVLRDNVDKLTLVAGRIGDPSSRPVPPLLP